MSHNTHSTVGQNSERVLYSPVGSNCKMRIANCELQNEGRIGPSPSALRPLRSGISLTEVLIAMGILTVGLLGVASIFPVASFYMQKGDVADRGSAIAQAAFNEALARGVFDPKNWYAMTATSFEPANYALAGDGPRGTFTRNVPQSITAARAVWPTLALCQRIGQVYVIDPLGAAAMASEVAPSNYDFAARALPASASIVNLKSDYYSPAWDQWLAATRTIFPVRRVTLRTARVGLPPASLVGTPFQFTQPLSGQVADGMFSSSDDLAIDVPAASDRPSVQLLATAGDGALARQSRGDYSWLATVVPRDVWNIADAPAEVSVVVFHKRQLFGSASGKTQDDLMQAAGTERMVRTSVVSTGLSGGELLLAPTNDGITESPFRSLKVGHWIMLCGPAPTTTAEHPQFVARWYRVLSIEAQAANAQIAVRGPAWPWQPQTGTNALSNNLCVAIFPGAVAVHSKTIKLGENSSWSVR